MGAANPESQEAHTPPVSLSGTARFRGFLSRVPRGAIALTITVLAQAVSIAWPHWVSSSLQGHNAFVIASLAAVFLAGAIQRWNGLHALVLLGLGLADFGLGFIIGHILPAPTGPRFPDRWIFGTAQTLLFLGMGEAFLTGHGNRRAAFWIPAAAVGIAALHETLVSAIGWTGWQSPLLRGGYLLVSGSLDPVPFWTFLAALVWSGLPLAFAAMKGSRLRAVLTGGAFAAALGFNALFFQYLAFTLSERSIQGRGPFAREKAALLLEARGRPEDFDLILRCLCEADWTNAGMVEPGRYSWHRTASWVLLRHDEMVKRTGDALASLLRRKRCRQLAQEVAYLMADQKRLEVAPILLRYALEGTPYVGPGMCNKALEKIGLPEAGLYILTQAAAYDRPESRPTDFPISVDRRKRLADLLGQDVGPNYSSWMKALTEALDKRRDLLPDAIQAECDREVDCFTEYANARERWFQARLEVGRKRLARRGLQREMQFQQYQWDATADMKVEEPNYDVPTVDLFEQEVTAYSERVDALLDKYFPSPSPTTGTAPESPASQSKPAD